MGRKQVKEWIILTSQWEKKQNENSNADSIVIHILKYHSLGMMGYDRANIQELDINKPCRLPGSVDFVTQPSGEGSS